MPWTSKESTKHTRKAKSAKSKRQWSKVANSVLARTGDDGAAIRIANGVVKKSSHKKKTRKKVSNK